MKCSSEMAKNMSTIITVRQRYNSFSGCSSGATDEFEDDESITSSPMAVRPPSRLKIWLHRLEIFLWLASALFIFYFGDFRSNFFSLLLKDPRIKRTALNLGLLCVFSNIGLFMFFDFRAKEVARIEDKWEMLISNAFPITIVFGLLAFILFTLALWPIWSFLTLPLLFTLFMASIVISPYISSYRKRKADEDLFRSD